MRYRSQTQTIERLRAWHQTVLATFLGFRKPLYSCTEGMCHSSTCPGTSYHMTQFYQAFPGISTASDECWGEKAWVRGWHLGSNYMDSTDQNLSRKPNTGGYWCCVFKSYNSVWWCCHGDVVMVMLLSGDCGQSSEDHASLFPSISNSYRFVFMYKCNLFQMKLASNSYTFQIVLTQNYKDFCIWFHQNSH